MMENDLQDESHLEKTEDFTNNVWTRRNEKWVFLSQMRGYGTHGTFKCNIKCFIGMLQHKRVWVMESF